MADVRTTAMEIVFGNSRVPRPTAALHPIPIHAICRNVGGQLASRGNGLEDLEAPVQHIRNIKGSIWAHGQKMTPRQLAGSVTWLANRAQNFALLIELHNPVVTAIDHPDMLLRCDVQATGVADVGQFPQIFPSASKIWMRLFSRSPT